MNRLVIIGNGFDMAHGLKTSYKDFINWYWDRRVDAFVGNISKVSEDSLCKLTIKDNPNLSCWNVFAFENSYFKDIRGNRTCSGYEVITELQKYPIPSLLIRLRSLEQSFNQSKQEAGLI